MYVEPVIAVNADMSGVQNPSMYKPVHIVNMPEAPTGGVTSVNGQTGDVTLTASDVGALPDSTTIPTVDQTYNAASTNAQSGTAVAGAIAGQPSKPLIDGDFTTVVEGTNDVKINFTGFPTFSSTDAGKVLTVQADGTLAWV